MPKPAPGFFLSVTNGTDLGSEVLHLCGGYLASCSNPEILQGVKHEKTTDMSYYFSKVLHTDFNSAIEIVTKGLQAGGFGIVTDIDLQSTFKKKLDKDIRPYRILGACNPNYAFEATQIENKIGTMLPCNVLVQELESGEVEVAAIDPVASMTAIPNDPLKGMAAQVGSMLKAIVDGLSA